MLEESLEDGVLPVEPSEPLVDLGGEDPLGLLESLFDVDPEEFPPSLPLVDLEESPEDEEEPP